MTPLNGFYVRGDLSGPRHPVNWFPAFAAHCAADPRTQPACESYLSLYTFGDDFADYLTRTGSTTGYGGLVAMPYHWFDIDRAGDLDAALADARGLAAAILAAYWRLDDSHLALFFSGSKGFHLGVPMPAGIEPTPDTPAVARFLAVRWAEAARVVIDRGIYDPSRCFRAPNSRHPKSGLHKRLLSYDELLGLTAARVVELACEPLAFDPPANIPDNPELINDWQQAAKGAAMERAARAERATRGSASLPKRTLALIRGEWLPDNGDRHRLLFSAAATLAELDCPLPLALELLTGPGLNCGLSPADVRRQIECGLAHGTRGPALDESDELPTERN